MSQTQANNQCFLPSGRLGRQQDTHEQKRYKDPTVLFPWLGQGAEEHRRGDNELPLPELETSERSLEGGPGAREGEGISEFLEETACAKGPGSVGGLKGELPLGCLTQTVGQGLGSLL